MIFGDRDELALEVDRFDPPWQPVDPDESVWAAVAVWVAGVNLTEHRRHGSDRVRDDLHIPLVPLARWCIAARAALHYEERTHLGAFTSPHEELDRWSTAALAPRLDEAAWLDRRDAWWSRHFTGSATADLVAPSLGIVRNDDRALVSWRTPDLPRPDRTFIRPSGAKIVSWTVVSAALDDYVAAVRAWSPSGQLEPTVEDAHGALEYYTGLAASELPAFRFLPEAVHDPAVDPLAQVVRDLTHRTSTGPAQGPIVKVIRAVGEHGDHGWWDMRARLVMAPGIGFEQEGYDGAQTVRRLLGLDGQPIDDVEKLARELGVQVTGDAPAADGDRMVVAGSAGGPAVSMLLASARTATPWGRRFEVARALGHLLLDPVRGAAIGAASGPRAMASRRRRSGAFAAELLLPTVALEEASAGALDGIAEGTRFAALLKRFGVGATTAAFHLWNQGFLSSPEVRDDLMASA